MKKFNKEDLQEMANTLYFSKNAEIQSMLATEDGNFFYPHAINYAKNHAKGSMVHVLNNPGIALKTQEKKEEIKQSSKAEKGKSKKGKPAELTKDELIKRINSLKNEKELDELDDIYKLSTSKDKEIKEAFEEKELSFF